jgi:nucleotide-binding universal stress UspA family protein
MARFDAEDTIMTQQNIRVLVAVHGYEPAGWATETGRVVSRWDDAVVRVANVLDVPRPPLTSPAPFARHLYRAAAAAARRDAEARTRAAVDALASLLPRGTEVVRLEAGPGPLGWTIAEHANDWQADVVVVGAPAPAFRSWLWPGPVPQQLLGRVTCAVLVTAPLAAVPPKRLFVVPRVAALERRA